MRGPDENYSYWYVGDGRVRIELRERLAGPLTLFSTSMSRLPVGGSWDPIGKSGEDHGRDKKAAEARVEELLDRGWTKVAPPEDSF